MKVYIYLSFVVHFYYCYPRDSQTVLTITRMFLLIVLQLCCFTAIAWDPDAGLAHSFTKTATSSVIGSPNSHDADLTVDGNTSTHWTSSKCLPAYYLSNPISNALKEACHDSHCSTSNTNIIPTLDPATDGDSSTNIHLKLGSNQNDNAAFEMQIPNPQHIRYVTLKGRYDSSSTHLKLFNQDRLLQQIKLTSADNYATKTFPVTTNETTTKIRIEFETELMLWEIAALAEKGCMDILTWDFGDAKEVGVIKTRHWAGSHGTSTQLFTSLDKMHWTHVADLDPQALSSVTTLLEKPLMTRYLKIEYTFADVDYASVYMWEIDAYDRYGEYGQANVPRPNPVSLADMLGVNGIWGWGHNTPSDHLKAGEGPYLYAQVASHARNYHNLNWDVTDPDLSADYDKMATGKGTQAKAWVNWDKEYSTWKKANLTVYVSLQFTSAMFPPNVWNTPKASARRIGEEFSKHFGPTHGTGTVTAVEVGNEPWDYEASFYNEILAGMANGLKTGDLNILVLSGAFQAENKNKKDNYLGTRVTQNEVLFLDAINTHHYSFLTKKNGVRIVTYPEHPASTFNGVRNIIRWRDANTPSKPVWVTEWGWDSPDAGQACHFPECVTDNAAAVYGIRGLLLLARYGVERATWFFYANLNDCNNHVFCRSGLTGSASVGFVKKKPFFAFQDLLHIFGNAHFINVIQEDEKAYVYTFGFIDGDAGRTVLTHIVAWRPLDADLPEDNSTVSFQLHAKPLISFCQVDGRFVRCDQKLPSISGDGIWRLEISPRPMIIKIENIGGEPVIG